MIGVPQTNSFADHLRIWPSSDCGVKLMSPCAFEVAALEASSPLTISSSREPWLMTEILTCVVGCA